MTLSELCRERFHHPLRSSVSSRRKQAIRQPLKHSWIILCRRKHKRSLRKRGSNRVAELLRCRDELSSRPVLFLRWHWPVWLSGEHALKTEPQKPKPSRISSRRLIPEE